MKSILLALLLIPLFTFSQDPPSTAPKNLPLRTRIVTDDATREAYRAEAKRKADSASMAAKADLKKFKDSVNSVISSIFGRMPIDTFTQLQADARYPTYSALATSLSNTVTQSVASVFSRLDTNRYRAAIVSLIPSVTFKDSLTKYYGPSGLINRPMKVWSDTGVVVTANPMPVNISSAGFSVITSIQVVARNAGGLLSSVPIVAERPPHSTSTIYFSMAVANLAGVVGLLTNFTGTTLSVRVEGY